MGHRLALIALALSAAAHAQQWRDLLNGKDLDGWQTRGNCIWTVMEGGTLLGQRSHEGMSNVFGTWPVPEKQFRSWLSRQAWLYTNAEFGEFDLHVEYWIPPGGNSGVSIRDISRAHYAIGEPDPAPFAIPEGTPRSTPAHIGYEIQIVDGPGGKYPSGSIYSIVPAKTGVQKKNQWNNLDIESRKDLIRVKVNGVVVAEHPGEPNRPKVGPIGLQLHDQFSFVMFRNIRIREIGK